MILIFHKMARLLVYIVNESIFKQFNTAQGVNLPAFDNKYVFWNLNEAKNFVFQPNIHSLKFFAFLAIIAYMIYYFLIGEYFTGKKVLLYVFGILSCAFYLWVNFSLMKLSGDSRPIKYSLISFVLSFIIMELLSSFVEKFVWTGKIFNTSLIIALILGIVFLVVTFLWFKSLSQITNDKIFVRSFILYIAIQILFFIFIAIFDSRDWDLNFRLLSYLNLIPNTMFVLAWLRFRKILTKC